MTGSGATTKFAPTTTVSLSCLSFKLKGKGRIEMWEVCPYGDKTIKVDRDNVEVLPRRVPSPSIGDVGFGPSPGLGNGSCHLRVVPAFRVWTGMSMNLADPVSIEKYGGT